MNQRWLVSLTRDKMTNCGTANGEGFVKMTFLPQCNQSNFVMSCVICFYSKVNTKDLTFPNIGNVIISLEPWQGWVERRARYLICLMLEKQPWYRCLQRAYASSPHEERNIRVYRKLNLHHDQWLAPIRILCEGKNSWWELLIYIYRFNSEMFIITSIYIILIRDF